jgi:YgiT-type zinc finger domain-containing protein
MLRQTSCEYQHEFTRTPVIEVERRGNDKVLIHYDVYFCESCGYTFKIITEIAEVKDYYKWI